MLFVEFIEFNSTHSDAARDCVLIMALAPAGILHVLLSTN